MQAPELQQLLDQAARHFRAGQFDKADLLGRQALNESPGQADMLDLLGVIAARGGRMTEAAELLRQAAAVRPYDPRILEHLGLVLQEIGQHDPAIAALSRLIELQPRNPAAYAQLGAIFSAKGDDAQSADAYRRAVAIKPDYVEAWNNLGLILHRQKYYDQAIAAYQRCIALRPTLPEAHNNLGNTLQAIGEPEAALAEFSRAISLRPQFATAHNNAGSALRELDRFEEANAAFDRAIALAPNFAAAYNNRGYTRAPAEIDAALADFQRAIALSPDFAAAHWNYALMLLRRGDLPLGWAEYEWRWRYEGFTSARRTFSQPRWDGSDLAGKTIYLHAEQGIGDTIQFIRYAPLLAARGAKVIVGCQPPLVRLMRSVSGISQIQCDDDPLPAFDVHLPLMSLPFICGTTLTTIPAEIPYLHAHPPCIEQWRQRIARDGEGFRVGVVWAGRAEHSEDSRRSIDLGALTPLWSTLGVRFYSLQIGTDAASVASRPLDLIDHTAHLDDFADTAAFIANLDLVITIDTAVAHLAGAMGKPTWVLLANMPDWRWMLGRSDSPWYPSVRLFRQSRPGEWGSVVEDVALELENTMRGREVRGSMWNETYCYACRS